MGGKPIGDVAMTGAQRQQRYRDKQKALRNAAPAADPVLDFLTQRPDAFAAGTYARIGPEMTRAHAVALRRHLWQIGSHADRQLPPRATPGVHLGWMRR